DPIRIISHRGKLSLIQPATGKDVTEMMTRFSESYLDSIPTIDGFILKARSPSCGIKDVKIFPGIDNSNILEKRAGFFGQTVLTKFPILPIEDEGRLTNFRIREHFLTGIFTLASFRALPKSMNDLVQFHTINKYLLMMYSQKTLRELGQIVANHEKKPVTIVFQEYRNTLFRAFINPPRFSSAINVCMHLLGYFSKHLAAKEKSFFLDTLDKYRLEKVPLSVPLSILSSWTVRFEVQYLTNQTLFYPYPEALTQITDSGKGRD
ncbi:MAG: YbgA family protein, partial [bacterium]